MIPADVTVLMTNINANLQCQIEEKYENKFLVLKSSVW